MFIIFIKSIKKAKKESIILLSNKISTMINTINKFLLAGENSMTEMHLKQTEVIFSECGTFTKKSNKIFIMIWLMEILRFRRKSYV